MEKILDVYIIKTVTVLQIKTMSDFEYDDFDEYAETGARFRHRPVGGGVTKVIQSTRRQQELARQMGKRRRGQFDSNIPSLVIRNNSSGGQTLGSGNTLGGGMPDEKKEEPAVGRGSKPGFFGENNKLDVNVHISKEEPKHETAPPDDHKKKIKYQIIKHVETNRDLYFVKLVAGSLKRPLDTIIVVEDEKAQGIDFNGKVVINLKYVYGNELLHGWSTIIEKVKQMIDNYGVFGWNSTESIHSNLIENDTTCTAFARYVGFIIAKEQNGLVPRNKTRYVIDEDGSFEDRLAVDLMRAINMEYKNLKHHLVQRFL